MTLQRYKNELILLVTILFALFAFLYRLSANSYVQENKIKIEQEISEVNQLVALKKQWGDKKVANRVKILKTIVPPSKVKSFHKKSKKVVASYYKLTANELNKLNNKLINIPVQIVQLNINKTAKNQYTMEFTCKW
jgi:hypothetical protein